MGFIANPRFASAANYHLSKGSPAIGAGIPFNGLTRDFDAVPRFNPLSIGAFEWSKISMCCTLLIEVEQPSDQ
jgi:hypothetical protein